MWENFVELVGFQLEKIHTGVIAWLVDTRNTSVKADQRAMLLSRLAGRALKS